MLPPNKRPRLEGSRPDLTYLDATAAWTFSHASTTVGLHRVQESMRLIMGVARPLPACTPIPDASSSMAERAYFELYGSVVGWAVDGKFLAELIAHYVSTWVRATHSETAHSKLQMNPRLASLARATDHFLRLAGMHNAIASQLPSGDLLVQPHLQPWIPGPINASISQATPPIHLSKSSLLPESPAYEATTKFEPPTRVKLAVPLPTTVYYQGLFPIPHILKVFHTNRIVPEGLMSTILQWVDAHDMIANVFLVCRLWRLSVRKPEAWATFCYNGTKVDAPDFVKLLGPGFGKNIDRFEVNLFKANYPPMHDTREKRVSFLEKVAPRWRALQTEGISTQNLRVYRVCVPFTMWPLPNLDLIRLRSFTWDGSLGGSPITITSMNKFLSLDVLEVYDTRITSSLPPQLKRFHFAAPMLQSPPHIIDLQFNTALEDLQIALTSSFSFAPLPNGCLSKVKKLVLDLPSLTTFQTLATAILSPPLPAFSASASPPPLPPLSSLPPPQPSGRILRSRGKKQTVEEEEEEAKKEKKIPASSVLRSAPQLEEFGWRGPLPQAVADFVTLIAPTIRCLTFDHPSRDVLAVGEEVMDMWDICQRLMVATVPQLRFLYFKVTQIFKRIRSMFRKPQPRQPTVGVHVFCQKGPSRVRVISILIHPFGLPCHVLLENLSTDTTIWSFEASPHDDWSSLFINDQLMVHIDTQSCPYLTKLKFSLTCPFPSSTSSCLCTRSRPYTLPFISFESHIAKT